MEFFSDEYIEKHLRSVFGSNYLNKKELDTCKLTRLEAMQLQREHAEPVTKGKYVKRTKEEKDAIRLKQINKVSLLAREITKVLVHEGMQGGSIEYPIEEYFNLRQTNRSVHTVRRKVHYILKNGFYVKTILIKLTYGYRKQGSLACDTMSMKDILSLKKFNIDFIRIAQKYGTEFNLKLFDRYDS